MKICWLIVETPQPLAVSWHSMWRHQRCRENFSTGVNNTSVCVCVCVWCNRRTWSTQYVCVTVDSGRGTVTLAWHVSSVLMDQSSHSVLVHWAATAQTSHVDRYLSSTTTGDFTTVGDLSDRYLSSTTTGDLLLQVTYYYRWLDVGQIPVVYYYYYYYRWLDVGQIPVVYYYYYYYRWLDVDRYLSSTTTTTGDLSDRYLSSTTTGDLLLQVTCRTDTCRLLLQVTYYYRWLDVGQIPVVYYYYYRWLDVGQIPVVYYYYYRWLVGQIPVVYYYRWLTTTGDLTSDRYLSSTTTTTGDLTWTDTCHLLLQVTYYYRWLDVDRYLSSTTAGDLLLQVT